MSAKEKQKISKILVIIIAITLLIIAIYIKFISNKEIYATNETRMKANNIQISKAPSINLEEIIQKNTKQLNSKEEIYEKAKS